MYQLNSERLQQKSTNHFVNQVNGVPEIRGLKSSDGHGLEKLLIVHTLIEIVALNFRTGAIQLHGFLEHRRSYCFWESVLRCSSFHGGTLRVFAVCENYNFSVSRRHQPRPAQTFDVRIIILSLVFLFLSLA